VWENGQFVAVDVITLTVVRVTIRINAARIGEKEIIPGRRKIFGLRFEPRKSRNILILQQVVNPLGYRNRVFEFENTGFEVE